ncbi:Lar family restriction alleviation protein [Sporomusa aerivorans]|uniref:Lar family restriction alleviation protein n=1 Tax=Sporomusa aerivorans TaxID=204936 RepID=UPI00352B74B6
MIELKNCPFCGGNEIDFSDCKRLEDCERFECCDEKEYVLVVCNFSKGGCGASSGYFDTKEKAVSAWNRRDGHGCTTSD